MVADTALGYRKHVYDGGRGHLYIQVMAQLDCRGQTYLSSRARSVELKVGTAGDVVRQLHHGGSCDKGEVKRSPSIFCISVADRDLWRNISTGF